MTTLAHRWVLGFALVAAASARGAAPPASMTTAQMRLESQKVIGASWKGTVDTVRMAWQEQARTRPSDPLPRVLLAFCTFPSDDSWNQFKAIATLYPDSPWAHLGMGLVYLSWKMREPAKAEFDLALKLDPGFYPATVGLADLATLKGDPPAAEALYRQALKVADDAQARTGLGAALEAQGKPDLALKEYAASYQLWKDQPAVVQQLFATARAANDLPKAADYAEQLAVLKPRDRPTRKQLAELRFELGEKDQAALEYERLLRLGNPELAVVDRLIGLYRELKRVEKEEAVLFQRLGLDKTDPAPLLRLAELAKSKGNAEGAEGHLLEAVARAPKSAEAQLGLAHLRLEKGVVHEAVLALRAAAAIDGPLQAGARTELSALEKTLKLAPKPAKGSPDAIYAKVASGLNAFYLERKAQKPGLGGQLKLKVRVDERGTVQSVDVLSDTVGDPTLTAHVYFGLHDAEYPKQKREPVFEFELGKKK